jgi:predicted outer membrane protein
VDPQTEEGKSLMARLQAEDVMLSSLEGDAFDKMYMTLVTNTQQSIMNLANERIESATDPEVKAFFTDLKTVIENRLKTAQDIMAKVYGDNI